MKVNVLMATYNRASQMVNGVTLVERAIISFLAQEYQDSTLTILDDCSTDNTKDILKKYERHRRIKIFYGEENKLPPNNWNWLWGKADGDLICQLHDDDELTKDSISRRVERMKYFKADVIYGGVIIQNLDATEQKVAHAQPPDADRIMVDEYINFTTLMYRRELSFRFDPGLRYYFDWLFKIRCLKECKTIFVPNAVMKYTTHHGQESNKCRRERMNAPEERAMRIKLEELYGRA